ncbi:MAG: hypothetical protein A2571_00080 [Candidatus Vogelbacteria bacterium RIFOXYD1_FULL_44_32]|uniref:Uncharacterized protein n=1 Tax=Candidatus Vogelbacteria bacterium RIFOXYD1_FULL_44_32 TaxID=1802438 RepID=A0A1G2QEC9_9BACT|nr:MAG: hypothetical protein A2571_00080 [Candidatus Vogelbacteria bacterium RIFOXYD1_FULL_44_32]
METSKFSGEGDYPVGVAIGVIIAVFVAVIIFMIGLPEVASNDFLGEGQEVTNTSEEADYTPAIPIPGEGVKLN